ncbi:MAG TPA: lipid A biosynthesis lauroyl acyltransferase [Xanthobacteraceae bacterium]
MARKRSRLKARAAPLLNAAAGFAAVGALKTIRLTSRRRMADLAGAVMRRVGPWRPEHRVARQNLQAAFPEKSPSEIESILAGVWDNLGRVTAEFAHLDRIRTYDPDIPGPFDIEYDQATYDRFHGLRLDGKPGLIFTAHLANWELSAMVAAAYKLDMIVVYRQPNMRAVADAVLQIRGNSMGELMPTGLDTPLRLGEALAAGRHAAMLVDQYAVRGVDVNFFGRTTKANPLLARLARQVECPIHGARMIRLPDHKFRIEMTDAIETPRDAEGRVDVQGTMQAITNVVEGWVREYPEQWLWVHRRWR